MKEYRLPKKDRAKIKSDVKEYLSQMYQDYKVFKVTIISKIEDKYLVKAYLERSYEDRKYVYLWYYNRDKMIISYIV